MGLQISDEILTKTSQCPYDFVCLTGDQYPKCPVENLIGETSLFIKSVKVDHEPYKMSFGNGHLCTCPTRKEIYKKYTI